MVGKTATEELELTDVGGPGGGLGRDDFGANGGEGDAAAPALSQRIYLTGVWIALAAILMFFMALTSSFIVRQGISNDWVPIKLPRILWFNTAVLLASSLTLARARYFQLRDLGREFRRWWMLTTTLGLAFLAGQLLAWQQLAAAGVYLDSNPSSSFFYLLTATHGAHLLGGIIALLYVGLRSERADVRQRRISLGLTRLSPRTAVSVSSIYWHFMDGLWVFLFLLLLFGR